MLAIGYRQPRIGRPPNDLCLIMSDQDCHSSADISSTDRNGLLWAVQSSHFRLQHASLERLVDSSTAQLTNLHTVSQIASTSLGISGINFTDLQLHCLILNDRPADRSTLPGDDQPSVWQYSPTIQNTNQSSKRRTTCLLMVIYNAV